VPSCKLGVESLNVVRESVLRAPGDPILRLGPAEHCVDSHRHLPYSLVGQCHVVRCHLPRRKFPDHSRGCLCRLAQEERRVRKLSDGRSLIDRGAGHVLRSIREPLCATVAVLSESFHMLEPQSVGSDRLREFIAKGAMSVWFFDLGALTRAFELMELYADRPMDLADASLVVAAEALETRKIFTIERNDFATYRVRRGHRHYALEVLG
jgi:uncharacterized protein